MNLVHRSWAVDAINEFFVLQYYCLASVVLLYYDHLLTFPMEVRRVWCRRLTLSSILFLINRYVVFGGYIFLLYLSFFPPRDDIEFCKWASRVGGYLSLLTQIIASILFSLRTYALYNRSWKVLCFVSLLGLSTIITSAWTINIFFGILIAFGLKGGSGSEFRTCVPAWIAKHKLVFVAANILSTIFDAAVFLLTVTRTLHIVRQNKKSGAQADLPNLLMRDGSVYFAIMIITNLLNVIIFLDESIPSTQFTKSTGNNSMLSHVISVTMISRLVLNLHGFEDRNRKVSVHPLRPPRYARGGSNSTDLDDTTREASFSNEGIGRETAQLTTQISVYPTWISRAMDGFECDAPLRGKENRYPSSSSDTSTITAAIESSYAPDSSHSTHCDDESAWTDDECEVTEQPRDDSVHDTNDGGTGVRRFSKGHGVWWVA